MVRALLETGFDLVYLFGVVITGILLIERGKSNSIVRKFGLMSVILGLGDGFHLVPRIIAMWNTGLENNLVSLGIGKLVTSITMTVFYLILYYIWKDYFKVKNTPEMDISILGFSLIRIILCLLPQNMWTEPNPSIFYGILRNIPFVFMGLIIVILFRKQNSSINDKVFRFIPIYVLLSFIFYIPVVLLSNYVPIIGVLMIPKTICYALIVFTGWRFERKLSKTEIKEEPKEEAKEVEKEQEENLEIKETEPEEDIEKEFDDDEI